MAPFRLTVRIAGPEDVAPDDHREGFGRAAALHVVPKPDVILGVANKPVRGMTIFLERTFSLNDCPSATVWIFGAYGFHGLAASLFKPKNVSVGILGLMPSL